MKRFFTRFNLGFSFLAFFLLISKQVAFTQISIPSSTAVTEDFTIGTSTTASLPSNWKMSAAGTGSTSLTYGAAANVTAVSQGASSGSPTAGGRYNWGNGTTTTDRAIGFMTSSGYGTPNSIMAYYRNTSGVQINDISITFDIERYRINSTNFSLSFYTSTDGNTWTSRTSGDVATSVFATGTSSYTFTGGTTVNKSISISGVNIANNGDFYVMWLFTTSSSNSQGLGLDNVSLTATLASSGTSTIAVGAGAEPTTISSLTTTQGAASLNFDIAIQDDGATPATDALATKISQMVFTQGTGNDVADWTLAIAGAELNDGTSSMIGTVAATTITFASINIANLGLIADNATKTYTLKVWLKTDMTTLKTTIDGSNLVFRIQTANVTTDPSFSQLAASQDQNSGLTNNAVAVVATVLAFVQQPSNALINATMTPSVTVSANDANSNRDLDYVTSVSMTSSGTLTGSPVAATPSAGLASYTTLTHTAVGTALQLTAASGALSSATSTTFNITVASNTTDYFRSAVTGDWATPATWESSSDNSNWSTATLAPTSSAATVTIRNGHTVTVSTSVTVDDIVIANGGILTINSTTGTLNLNNGTATNDIDINNGGVLQVTGNASYSTTILIAASANINIGTGGKITFAGTGGGYNAFATSSTGIIWNDGAIFEWNSSNTPSASGLTFFPNASISTIPKLRVSIGWGIPGGASNTTINGKIEVNASFTWGGAGTKTFRNGITGTATMSQSTTGAWNITGSTADLGGVSGTLVLSLGTNGLLINASSVTTLSSNTTVNTGTLTVASTGTLDLSTYVLSGTGGVAVSSGGIVKSANATGIAGSITTTTKSFSSAADYEFNSSATGTFTTTPTANTVNTLTVNNATGVTLSSSLTATSIVFTSGKLTLGSNNLTTAAITGGSSSSYVVTNSTGALTINAVNTATFPVGPTASAYNPVTISNGDAKNYAVTVSATAPAGGGIAQPTKVINRTWDITPNTTPTKNVGLAFTYNSGEGASAFNNTATMDGLHFLGGSWQNIGTATPTPSAPYVVTFTNLSTSWSPFSFGNAGVLSAELTSLKAKAQNTQNLITWQTATEKNTHSFDVERSADGLSNWQTMGTVKAAGHSQTVKDYQFTDDAPLSISYYRLRLVDIDGAEMKSNIVSVSQGKSTKLTVYPSIVSDKLMVSTDNDDVQTYIITDLLGRNVQTGQFRTQTELSVGTLTKGIYMVKVGTETAKFWKQ